MKYTSIIVITDCIKMYKSFYMKLEYLNCKAYYQSICNKKKLLWISTNQCCSLFTDKYEYAKPWISKKSSARIDGPLSLGFPDPLNTRPTSKNKQMNIQMIVFLYLTCPLIQEYVKYHQ